MGFFSLKTKLRLARSVLTKDHPVYVQFYITARCNLACEQCNVIYANSDVTESDIGRIAKIADNLEKIGVSIVLLTGGEPFTRKDLPAIIHEFAKRDIHVRIQTNGLAELSSLEECIKAGAKDISISLDTIHPPTQDQINGAVPNSWEKAIEAISNVNRVFPSSSFSALGCVLAPRNITHIPDLIEFATKIGWFVSLVPAHSTKIDDPMSFRTFDDACRFTPDMYPAVKKTLEQVKTMRDNGYLVYDSDEYLDDMYRLVTGQPVQWRARNRGVCDSPNLYFAILPNGNMAVCCDLRLHSTVSVADKAFPKTFFSQQLRREAKSIASACGGCLYGSFPEMTITTRYFMPLFRRALFFNFGKTRELPKYSKEEMIQLASEIRAKSSVSYS